MDRLRSGDEAAFRELLVRHNGSLIGVAMGIVRNRATAEEVVQDTWLAVIAGLDKFEGRSSLKNWIFAILVNKARSRAVRDSRLVSHDGTSVTADDDELLAIAGRFDRSGNWAVPPVPWDELTPERIVAGREIWSHVAEAIEALPDTQKSVLIMREIEEMDPKEVGEILGISDVNQRVILHRARAKIRGFLDRLLNSKDRPGR